MRRQRKFTAVNIEVTILVITWSHLEVFLKAFLIVATTVYKFVYHGKLVHVTVGVINRGPVLSLRCAPLTQWPPPSPPTRHVPSDSFGFHASFKGNPLQTKIDDVGAPPPGWVCSRLRQCKLFHWKSSHMIYITDSKHQRIIEFAFAFEQCVLSLDTINILIASDNDGIEKLDAKCIYRISM